MPPAPLWSNMAHPIFGGEVEHINDLCEISKEMDNVFMRHMHVQVLRLRAAANLLLFHHISAPEHTRESNYSLKDAECASLY